MSTSANPRAASDTAAARRALAQAEQRLAALLSRFDDLSSQVATARREAEEALKLLRVGSDSAAVELLAETSPVPTRREPNLAETTDMRLKSASNMAETSEMPVLPPREETPPPDGTIRFTCAHCGARLSAPAKYVGKSASCRCGQRSTIPARSTREPGAKK